MGSGSEMWGWDGGGYVAVTVAVNIIQRNRLLINRS